MEGYKSSWNYHDMELRNVKKYKNNQSAISELMSTAVQN